MTLATRRRRGMAIENVVRQARAERRMDEIVSVAGIADDYAAVDRAGDLAIEDHFTRLYRLVDTEDEKRAVADAFAVWQASERREDLAVNTSVGESVETLKSNNDLWLSDGCGPDGRAA